jgi:hypothetical protein
VEETESGSPLLISFTDGGMVCVFFVASLLLFVLVVYFHPGTVLFVERDGVMMKQPVL